MYTNQELNRIKWECRRGMRELDLIIETFFEKDFLNQSDEIQELFVEILEESDLNLFRWLLRGENPPTSEKQKIIDVILNCHNTRINKL